MARYCFQGKGFAPLFEHKIARREQPAVQFSARSGLAGVEAVDLTLRMPVEGKKVLSEIEKQLRKVVGAMGGR